MSSPLSLILYARFIFYLVGIARIRTQDMLFILRTICLPYVFFLSITVGAIHLDVNDTDSIKQVASIIAHDLIQYYTGNTTGGSLGLFPAPYYCWESGAVWGALIEYWHYTNDTTYNGLVIQALSSQTAPTQNFMPLEQMYDEGNDDQSFWAFAAMSAAERSFPSPPQPSPSWLTFATNVWNDLVSRWNTESCGGGLKWQIFPSNVGYDYKNSPSNGALFQLSARLARYTGNQTYLFWAEESWNWMSDIGLIDRRSFNVYDGTDDTLNCSEINHIAWTYNAGMILSGAAYLANYTADPLWLDRTNNLLASAVQFFGAFDNSTGIMYEATCEKFNTCNNDQFSFKAYLARWMSVTASLIPDAQAAILELLRASAFGAARSCSGIDPTKVGGSSNSTCGTKWFTSEWDGTSGLGQQLSALEIIQGLLLEFSGPPGVNGTTVNIQKAKVTSTVVLPTATPRPTGVSPIDVGGKVGLGSGSSSISAIDSLFAATMFGGILVVVSIGIMV